METDNNINKKIIYNFFIFDLNDIFIPEVEIPTFKKDLDHKERILKDIFGYMEHGYINYLEIKRDKKYSLIFNCQLGIIEGFLSRIYINSFYYGTHDIKTHQIIIQKYESHLSKRKTMILGYGPKEDTKTLIFNDVSKLNSSDYYLSKEELDKVLKLNDEEWNKIWDVRNEKYFKRCFEEVCFSSRILYRYRQSLFGVPLKKK